LLVHNVLLLLHIVQLLLHVVQLLLHVVQLLLNWCKPWRRYSFNSEHFQHMA
jgi:hypothetical protein